MLSNDMLGQIIDDSFRILSPLGAGGMGEVYLAEQIGLNRKVAIKFLQDQLISDLAWQERFRREGKILGSLLHPNIVRCFAYGFWQGKLPYLIFEYIEGKTLKNVFEERRVLPWRYVFQLALSICAALEYAHGAGVVHRDLKPDNIIVFGDNEIPQVKLLDFGLARVCSGGEDHSATVTKTGQLLGTVHYMSPEQCVGKDAEPRSDLYALGCIMYQAVTGKYPLDADSSFGIIYKHLNEYATLPSELINQLPKPVDAVLLKSMAKVPEQRYASATEMAEEISRVLEGDLGQSLTDLNIKIPDELRNKLSSSNTVKFSKQRVVAFTALLLACITILYVLSDPGTEPLFESYASKLPPKKRLEFLNSSAAYFFKNKRYQAANRLFVMIKQEPGAANNLNDALLSARLATCSLGLGMRSAAISRATDALAIAAVNGAHRNYIDDEAIQLATALVEKTEAPCEFELERSLQVIATQKPFAHDYKATMNANIALQSLPLSQREGTSTRAIILIEGLQLAFDHDDKKSAQLMIDYGRKRVLKLAACRDSLKYLLDLTEAELKKPGKIIGLLISQIVIQTMVTDKIAERDRTKFGAYTLEIPPVTELNRINPEALVKLVNSNKNLELRAYAAQLAAKMYRETKSFQDSLNMLKQVVILIREIDPSDMLHKKRLLDLSILIVKKIPTSYDDTLMLSRALYDESKELGVTISAESMLTVAAVLSCHKSVTDNELLRLLHQAQISENAAPRVENIFIEELTNCIDAMGANGKISAKLEAIRMLKANGILAPESEQTAYWEYMKSELKTTHADGAAYCEKQAAKTAILRMQRNLHEDVGKTILH